MQYMGVRRMGHVDLDDMLDALILVQRPDLVPRVAP